MRVGKSIKVAPGVKANIGKKSVGVSVGGKYGGVSVNSSGRTTKRVSAPGTGVSYVKQESLGKGKASASGEPSQTGGGNSLGIGCAVVVLAPVVFFLVWALSTGSALLSGVAIAAVIAASIVTIAALM